MKIFDEFTNLDNVSLALGFFDGVHKGHKAVISKQDGSNLAVITFKKHPLETFGKECKYITTLKKRKELIEKSGADYLFEIDFTEEFSHITGEEYLKTLIKYFHPACIITGFNHNFGNNKQGAYLLEKMQADYSYKYIQIPPQTFNNEIISSTNIKEYLAKGDIQTANSMLGYNFSISGRVIQGNKIGRTIGFPTANIIYPENIIQIPFGVYCTKINGMKAVTNYGIKPTLGQSEPVVESHILNFSQNIYDKEIEIEFIKKIRDEKKFDSIEELKVQINKDTEECLKLL